MSNIVKTCYIVGAGFMGSTHLSCHLKNPRVKVLGIVDSDVSKAQKLASDNGCDYYSSLEDALNKQQVDFIDICLPTFLHCDAVIYGLDHGCDVIVEKPFSNSLQEIELMINKAREINKKLAVAHVCRFMPQYYLAKRMLENGSLGSPIALYCNREATAPSWGKWFLDKKLSGGTLLDLSIHDIDIANWFFGTPKDFHTTISERGDFKGAFYTSTNLLYDGPQATIISSHLMPKGCNQTDSFRLLCTKACLEWNTETCPKQLVLYKEGTKEIIPFEGIDKIASEEPYAYELQCFVDSLIDGTTFAVNVQDAQKAVWVVNELYKNSLTTDPVGQLIQN